MIKQFLRPESPRLRDDPDFRRFWAARVVSLAGSAVTYVALPVVVYDLSRSPLLTALVAASEALPYLLFGLFAGAIGDRTDRKRLMVGTDLLNVLVLGSVPVAGWLGALTVAHVLAAAFLTATLFVFFDAGAFGALPAIVGRERLPAANSAIWGAGTVVEIAAPATGGALLALVSGASLLALDALSFLASALLLRAVARPLSTARDDRSPRPAALRGEIREGLRFLWRHDAVRVMTLAGGAQALAGGAFVGQWVVWADRELGVRAGDARLGVLFAAWGAGALLGTTALPRLSRRLGAPRVALLGLPVSAALGILTVLAPAWPTATLLTAAWGGAYILVVVNAITYRQQVTPEPLMSRVNTAGRMLSFGLGWPLGAALSGTVAEAAGPVPGMLAGVAVLAGGAAYAWRSPLREAPPRPGPATVDGDRP